MAMDIQTRMPNGPLQMALMRALMVVETPLKIELDVTIKTATVIRTRALIGPSLTVLMRMSKTQLVGSRRQIPPRIPYQADLQ
tara:strand:+ start:75 stop:323 length:249 start_codon:yes stop_codon:yes gene_type:complete